MTIVNVAIRHDRAIVAVDTQTIAKLDDDFPEFDSTRDVSKMIPLVHANTVFAVRGSLAWLPIAFGQMFTMALENGIDDVASVLPSLLNAVSADPSIPAAVSEGPQEVWAVGWSKKRGCPRGIVCIRQPDATFEVHEVGEAVAPELESDIPPMWQPEQMAALARRQVAMQRERFPGAPIGGRLLQAEITATGMTIREVCDLG